MGAVTKGLVSKDSCEQQHMFSKGANGSVVPLTLASEDMGPM